MVACAAQISLLLTRGALEADYGGGFVFRSQTLWRRSRVGSLSAGLRRDLRDRVSEAVRSFALKESEISY